MVRIDDPEDPRLAEYRAFADHGLLANRRAFVAEGRLVVERLIADRRFTIRSLLLNPAAALALEASLAALAAQQPEVPVYVTAPAAFPAITGFNLHRGCVAIADRPPAADLETLLGATLLVVLEGIADADNVGGIFRNAAAFGADAVVLSPTCCDPLYRKAIRTSMAAALRVPFVRAAAWPDDLQRLRDAGFALAAFTPADDAAPIDAFAREYGGRRLALMFGNEGAGLTDAARRRADVQVTIPISRGVDSLNVAVAAGIVLSRMSRV